MTSLFPKTVGKSNDLSDDDYVSKALTSKQQEQVSGMRAAMLMCDESDPFSIQSTMKSVLAMRIYHQVMRIIKYTEQMDRIEDTLYKTIDDTLEHIDMDVGRDFGHCARQLSLLLDLQEQLQKSMIESQKLLDPYLNIKELTYIDVPNDDIEITTEAKVLDQNSRSKIREGAQLLLDTIDIEGDRIER